MSISKVTPVTAAPKSTPPPDALIIPAVAHAGGINSLFQSDVRVTNSSAQLLQYQATFTPSGSQGLAAGRQTTFSIDAGRTIALDDVLRGWFGTGGDNVMGTLEIRPMTQTETSTSNLPLSGLADLVEQSFVLAAGLVGFVDRLDLLFLSVGQLDAAKHSHAAAHSVAAVMHTAAFSEFAAASAATFKLFSLGAVRFRCFGGLRRGEYTECSESDCECGSSK
jgi:hypothetical protein